MRFVVVGNVVYIEQVVGFVVVVVEFAVVRLEII